MHEGSSGLKHDSCYAVKPIAAWNCQENSLEMLYLLMASCDPNLCRDAARAIAGILVGLL